MTRCESILRFVAGFVARPGNWGLGPSAFPPGKSNLASFLSLHGSFPVLLAALLMWQPARAGNVELSFTDSTNKETTTVTLTVKVGKVNRKAEVTILPGSSAEVKRDKILAKIFSLKEWEGGAISDGTSGLTLYSLSTGAVVTFEPGKTGEEADTLIASNSPGASFGFQNTAYAPVDATGNDAVFVGGFVTDVGDLSFALPASSLASLDGNAIIEALFENLNPYAPTYGVDIFNGGDYLGFTFDSRLTTRGGGVIFGTTSLSDGTFGSVVVGVPEPASAPLVMLGLVLLLLARIPRAKRCLPDRRSAPAWQHAAAEPERALKQEK